MELIFFKPVFKEKVWGGSYFREEYGFDLPSERTGECWLIGAHENGDSEIASGYYQGKTLGWLYREHRELFGMRREERYPLLVKIIDAQDKLSVQVHPDDSYARIHENGSPGKKECWYILNCEPDSKIIIGHRAKTKQELQERIRRGQWKELLWEIPIQKGDFFVIEPGCIHAIEEGTQILEIQENSDITYRLYDYGRLQNGIPRELHTEKAVDVIRVPYEQPMLSGMEERTDSYVKRWLVSCEAFTVWKLEVMGSASFLQNDDFLNVCVTEGQGEIDGREIQKGDAFMIPSGYGAYTMKGTFSCMVSAPGHVLSAEE